VPARVLARNRQKGVAYHHPLFLCVFFKVRFGRLSVRGVQNKYFCKKSMEKTLYKKIDKSFHVRFSTVFCFIAGSSKALQKTICKKIVSKSFYNCFDKTIQTQFYLDLFNHVFGRFLATRSEGMFHVKFLCQVFLATFRSKNIGKKHLALLLFCPLTYLPTTGVLEFDFFAGPLVSKCASVRAGGPHARGPSLRPSLEGLTATATPTAGLQAALVIDTYLPFNPPSRGDPRPSRRVPSKMPHREGPSFFSPTDLPVHLLHLRPTCLPTYLPTYRVFFRVFF
jgi:hypothetical protein